MGLGSFLTQSRCRSWPVAYQEPAEQEGAKTKARRFTPAGLEPRRARSGDSATAQARQGLQDRSLISAAATFRPPCRQSNYSGSFRGLCRIILEDSGSVTIAGDFI